MAEEHDIETLLQNHRAMMLSYARTVMGQYAAHADDAVQEACLAAVKNFEKFNASQGTFGSWVRGITRYKSLERLRKLGRYSSVSIDEIAEGVEEVYEMVDRPTSPHSTWQEQASLIWRCVERLNQGMKSVITWFYKSELSVKEIAQKADINIATVTQRLSRGRQAIRACVEKEKGPHE